MHYSQIPGQHAVKDKLREMAGSGRVPHALLIAGAEGFGTLPLALVFAQHLFCTSPDQEGPCGKCPACAKVNALSHPDLHLVFPVALSKDVRRSDDLVAEFREAFSEDLFLSLDKWFAYIDAANKQPVIAVDEAAEILRALSFTSYEGGYKIVLIWHPETMNVQSANKLLKILEEPPEKTVFMLVCPRPQQLLSTILSRVQVISCAPCEDAEIAAALRSEYGVDADSANETALLADGNFGEAVALLGSREESVSFLQTFQAFMRLSLKFDCAKALQWIDDCAMQGRERQKQFLQYGLGVFRDSLMQNFGSRELVKLSGQEKQFLEKFAPFVTQRNYEKLVEEFNTNYYYLERNANSKILFMDLLLRTGELLNQK
jgi:DNA polymerase-3 subunit delta'